MVSSDSRMPWADVKSQDHDSLKNLCSSIFTCRAIGRLLVVLLLLNLFAKIFLLEKGTVTDINEGENKFTWKLARRFVVASGCSTSSIYWEADRVILLDSCICGQSAENLVDDHCRAIQKLNSLELIHLLLSNISSAQRELVESQVNIGIAVSSHLQDQDIVTPGAALNFIMRNWVRPQDSVLFLINPYASATDMAIPCNASHVFPTSTLLFPSPPTQYRRDRPYASSFWLQEPMDAQPSVEIPWMLIPGEFWEAAGRFDERFRSWSWVIQDFLTRLAGSQPGGLSMEGFFSREIKSKARQKKVNLTSLRSPLAWWQVQLNDLVTQDLDSRVLIPSWKGSDPQMSFRIVDQGNQTLDPSTFPSKSNSLVNTSLCVFPVSRHMPIIPSDSATFLSPGRQEEILTQNIRKLLHHHHHFPTSTLASLSPEYLAAMFPCYDGTPHLVVRLPRADVWTRIHGYAAAVALAQKYERHLRVIWEVDQLCPAPMEELIVGHEGREVWSHFDEREAHPTVYDSLRAPEGSGDEAAAGFAGAVEKLLSESQKHVYVLGTLALRGNLLQEVEKVVRSIVLTEPVQLLIRRSLEFALSIAQGQHFVLVTGGSYVAPPTEPATDTVRLLTGLIAKLNACLAQDPVKGSIFVHTLRKGSALLNTLLAFYGERVFVLGHPECHGAQPQSRSGRYPPGFSTSACPNPLYADVAAPWVMAALSSRGSLVLAAHSNDPMASIVRMLAPQATVLENNKDLPRPVAQVPPEVTVGKPGLLLISYNSEELYGENLKDNYRETEVTQAAESFYRRAVPLQTANDSLQAERPFQFGVFSDHGVASTEVPKLFDFVKRPQGKETLLGQPLRPLLASSHAFLRQNPQLQGKAKWPRKLVKIQHLALSPFAGGTLFVDTDTYCCADVAPLFSLFSSSNFDIAIGKEAHPPGLGDEAWNSGVILYRKSPLTRLFFTLWEQVYLTECIFPGFKDNDQCALAIVIRRVRAAKWPIRIHRLVPEFNLRLSQEDWSEGASWKRKNMHSDCIRGPIAILHSREIRPVEAACDAMNEGWERMRIVGASRNKIPIVWHSQEECRIATSTTCMCVEARNQGLKNISRNSYQWLHEE